uniref:Uncharacterized protein n=1 Tax=Myoviridae sp. ctCo31 TaxID=2825053 RepID=A0A8S5UMW2_9CAUD|nr:MAG TPA: hypothetical protein [Myoviridae sp. ctCo31]
MKHQNLLIIQNTQNSFQLLHRVVTLKIKTILLDLKDIIEPTQLVLLQKSSQMAQKLIKSLVINLKLLKRTVM